MSTNRFLTIKNGLRQLVIAISQSVGAADANKIISTGSDGKIHSSFLPAGVALQTEAIVAGEALAAGDFVNIFDNAGARTVRKADASNARAAHGYVLASVTNGQTATVFKTGSNTGVTGLTSGQQRWLSAATPGASSAAAPTPTSGQIIQLLGYADSATSILFEYDEPTTVE